MELTRRKVAKLLLGLTSAPAALGVPPFGVAKAVRALGADSDAIPANSAFVDTRRYDGPAAIDCDLCIVGAGAAGITLALTLSRAGRRVIALESGGLSYDGLTQSLYRGRLTGVRYFDLASCRVRYFGGSTTHWGGFCRPPLPTAFEARPALGLPEWPVGYDELKPYLTQAAASLGVDLDHFDPQSFTEAETARAPVVDTASPVLRTEIFHVLRPRIRNFNHRYLQAVARLPDTRVFLYANLTHIALADNGSTVRALTARTLDGKELAIRPKAAVLACHAIENARLLLISNDVITTGIGNASDQVGRNFMDHLKVKAGRFIPNKRNPIKRYFVDALAPRAQRVMQANIGVTPKALRDNEMLTYFLDLEPRFDPIDERTGAAAAELTRSFFEPFEMQMARDAGALIAHPLSGSASTLTRLGLRRRMPAYFDILHNCEPAPNPSSRITLTSERDSLGLPMVSLNWALSDADIHTLARGQQIVIQALTALGIGRFEGPPVTRDLVEQNVLGHWHNAGTTRMSASPSTGVVDRNCRVHGTDNLFVAGSGVFPSSTGGWPTMLLIALALRLAEHLDTKVLS